MEEMDDFEKKVTVIIPTYKRSWKFLNRALNSVQRQTYKNLEIIVIDDSPDVYEFRLDIVNHMQDVCESDKRVKYMMNKKNLGGSLARNRGIEIASGDYVTFLDDDDEYLPDKIMRQVKFMKESNCDLSFESLTMYSIDGQVVDFREFQDIESYDKEYLLKYHLMKHMTGTPTFMFKSDSLRYIGGFEDVKMGQEFYLMLKAIEKDLQIRYLPVCDVKCYKHGEGVTHGKNKIDGEKHLYQFKQKYFDRLGKKEICFIRFRHYAVMVVAYIRNKQYYMVPAAVIEAFISSPEDFFQQVTGFFIKVVKKRRIKNCDAIM